MKRMNHLAAGLACALAVSGNALAAADYKGADALLTQLVAPNPGTGKKAEPPAAQWIDDMEAFRAKSGTLPPDEAARQWLDLASRYSGLRFEDLGALSPADQNRFSIELHGAGTLQDPILSSLPGPASWPALARLVDARPARKEPRDVAFDAALALVAHTLIADPAGQQKALQTISTIKHPNLPSFIQELDIASLEDALASGSGDPADVVKAFQSKLALQQKLIKEKAAGGGERFTVPDLVTIMGGEKEAEPLVTQAVLLPNVLLDITGAETRRMATRIALEQVASLTSPHWELTCSMDGEALYDALQRRFPDPGTGSGSNRSSVADGYHFLRLIVAGQSDKAVAMAETLSTDFTVTIPVDELDRNGYTQEVHDFLHSLLTKHPEVPLWGEYIGLSAKTGQTAQMLDLIRAAAKRTDLPDTQRDSARASFYLALLAADQIDEGVGELRKIIVAGQQGESSPLGKSVALARIGQLLERNDLLEEGIAGAEKHAREDPVPSLNIFSESVTSLAELLTQIGRGPEAEKMLGEILGRFSAAGPAQPKQVWLAALMRVYYHAGRPDDVTAVLEKFPGWGVADLKDVLTLETDGFSVAEYSTHAAPDSLPAGYMAAWALAQRGQKEQALKIIGALLDQDEAFDPGYELFTKLSGEEAIPRLDLLARRDRFQTRPLIWKAQIQLDAGKLDDAEKTVREAIAIDPSDGEQGPGRRMRAYAVLADVLDRKGDKEHAQLYHGVVDAIRISERADRFYEAGLLKRAVSMYEEALTHFSDAYCIQSRLALRLSEMGDNAGAEEHYRRAYELMPDSFGRVESHCFGCERAFEGFKPQSIAEKVFTQLAVKMPGKPQVHYLLGYLRSAQGRYREALPEFEEAVKLDPDYLNAWKELGDLNEQMYLPEKLNNEVALAEVRLDPLQRHGESPAQYATDLAGLWNTAAAAKELQPAPAGPLLPLTASAEELTKANASGNGLGVDQSYASAALTPTIPQPVDLITANRFILMASRVMGSLQMFDSPQLFGSE